MTSNILDLAYNINNYKFAVVDLSGYDYFIIQPINLGGTIYTYSTNNSGAIEGIRDGGISQPIQCTIEATNPQVTTKSTANLAVGDIVYGYGVGVGSGSSNVIVSIDSETQFTMNAAATDDTVSDLTFVYAKDWTPIATENLSDGKFDTGFGSSNGNYRCSNPIGNYLLIDGLAAEVDKLLIYMSKIY
mgnify:CR=1 FL=1